MRKIPLLLNANSIVNNNKNQILFLFNSFTKNEWLKELTRNDSNIYELIKEEVEELFLNTGGYIIYLDFESCYKLAVEITINQIEKSIKKTEKCFFENPTNDNVLIYKKVKERLVNNLKNLFDSKRKINVMNYEIWIMDKVYEIQEYNFIVRDLKKLINQKPELVINIIKELIDNSEFNIFEAEELAEILDINISDITDSEINIQFRDLRKSSNYLSYEEELKVA